MLIGINQVGENCSKSSSGHEAAVSGTTTPKSESTQPYSSQIKPSKQMAYPQYPPGREIMCNFDVLCKQTNKNEFIYCFNTSK